VRALRLLLVFGLMALAALVGGGQALACDQAVGASAATATQPSAAQRAEPLSAAARFSRDGHRHHGPHQHDTPDGCCMLCCGATVSPVLLPQPQLAFERPIGAVMPVWQATAVAKAGCCLPFRPPRTA
jgi:hypothetical protein